MKPQQIKNPHDHFFRESMERKIIAYAFIMKIFDKEISSQIDFTSLHIVKDIWIDTELSKHEADIVYVAKVKNSSGLIYFLFEHKSFLDDQVFIQNNRYISEIHEQIKKEQPRLKKYPVVIPCIVYHGKTSWIYGNNINRAFEYIKGIEKYVPVYETEIIEIVKVDIDFKSMPIELTAMLFAFKYGRVGQINDKLHLLLDIFDNCTEAQFEYLLVVLKYLVVILSKGLRRKFLETVNTHNFGKKRSMKTIADSLIEEGEQMGVKKGETIGVRKGEAIGVKIGVKKGERTGIKKGSSDTAIIFTKRMVKEGFDDKMIRKITHLTQKKIDEIRNEV